MWTRKTHERFRAYLHKRSMDKHQIYLKQRNWQLGRIILTENWGNALRSSNSQKIPPMGESESNEPIEFYRITGRAGLVATIN